MASIDPVVIVTGGAKGIGLACSRRFQKDDYRIVIADRDEEAGKSAEEEINANGGQAIFVKADIAERLDIHNLVAAALEEFDRVDVLVNNAATNASQDFLDIEEGDWDKILRVNLTGPFLTSQAVARQVVKQIDEGRTPDRGANYSIINISAVDAVMSSADQIPFAVSKGGLNQLTKVLSLALAKHGMRVNAIGPGSIMTDTTKSTLEDGAARKMVLSRTPLGRIGSPEEIAGIAGFLASEEASYITGQCIYADGGRLIQNVVIEQG
jgi:glucose 1-dehydrogenase